MQQTFKEFTFEAAHQTPPFSRLHGHSFRVEVVLSGPLHPVFGWSHNFFEVEAAIAEVRGALDHNYLNEIEGLEMPSLENLTAWIWHRLNAKLSGLDRVIVRRGLEGQIEGCAYSGPVANAALAQAKAAEYAA